jgi:hypothetical protein
MREEKGRKGKGEDKRMVERVERREEKRRRE